MIKYNNNLDLQNIVYFCEVDLIEKTEKWKDVVGYEGLYKVSNLSRIKSVKRYVRHRMGGTRVQNERIIKQIINKKSNHISFKLSKNGNAKTFGLHVIVAMANIPNPLNLPIVEHKNDNPLDNRPENLEWSTYSNNMKNCFKRGRWGDRGGEKHGNSKLTEQQVLEIRESNLLQRELSLMYKVGQDVISRLKSRKSWKNTN